MKKLTLPLLLISTFFIPISQASNELSTKIVNGTKTSTVTFSDFVSLFYDRISYDGIYTVHSLCGGTLLAPQYVLTAAHCIFDGDGNIDEDHVLYMAVGQVDDESSYPDNVATVRASEFYYNGYTDSSAVLWENDIAIIKLASPLNVSGTVDRVRDENEYRNADNKFIAIGHGDTEQGIGTTQLLETTLSYIDNEACKNSSSLFSGIHDSQLCFTGAAKNTTTLLTNGICSGDSGGPVYWEESSGHFVQVGLTSFGPSSCGTGIGSKLVTGVFTEIADYDSWINQVLNGEVTPQYLATDEKRTSYYETHYQPVGDSATSDDDSSDDSVTGDDNSSDDSVTGDDNSSDDSATGDDNSSDDSATGDDNSSDDSATGDDDSSDDNAASDGDTLNSEVLSTASGSSGGSMGGFMLLGLVGLFVGRRARK